MISTEYYDLIELPTGRHIPVPIARRLIGEAVLGAIPKSHKIRNSEFFYCQQCADFLKATHPVFGLEIYGVDVCDSFGHSFYRCKIHDPQSAEDFKKKEDMLVRLILTGMYKSLRYVRSAVV